MFRPPPTLLTPDFRLRLYSAAPPHGPSYPCPSRPVPVRIRHVSPVTRSARPTCLTVRAHFPAIHTILPLRLMRTPSTCISLPLFIAHHLSHIGSAFILTGRAPLRTSVLYFSHPSLHPPATLPVLATPPIMDAPRAALPRVCARIPLAIHPTSPVSPHSPPAGTTIPPSILASIHPTPPPILHAHVPVSYSLSMSFFVAHTPPSMRVCNTTFLALP